MWWEARKAEEAPQAITVSYYVWSRAGSWEVPYFSLVCFLKLNVEGPGGVSLSVTCRAYDAVVWRLVCVFASDITCMGGLILDTTSHRLSLVNSSAFLHKLVEYI